MAFLYFCGTQNFLRWLLYAFLRMMPSSTFVLDLIFSLFSSHFWAFRGHFYSDMPSLSSLSFSPGGGMTSVLKNSESARERARARRTFQNFQLRERAASSSSKFRGEWASNESARRSLARGSLAIFLPNPKMPHFGQERVAEGGCWVDLSKGDHE